MHSVVETSSFTRRADALLSQAERAELIATLANNPEAGDVMVGLGGVRKLRWAPAGRGKSGAFRVIYYLLNEGRPILAFFLYGKNEQADLTPVQRKAVQQLVATMKEMR
ncbi:type II toxin-antitoxin system RelE/ParE family toxin [Falsiroseomonas selenitidurans]|uniref:Type II toxin-antitoxin system RelE/ParE family toxin n=1 Tax=Falsiroseomonas selenitidurans TaxID=2716335 RepID=A0ABX1DZC6_9PROT|nr:type II toxin-antitoxin system RelE/ParE family toxin [Falsiroseomonas selenitidurans]NKC30201.1 type II toxin-antitoxin system RelE/ParE family toxin [Falsiroseomonas selenitidurans]